MLDTHANKLRLDEVAALFPGNAGRPGLNVATIRRWAVRGVRGVKLRTYKVGCRRLTTRADVEQFIAAQNGGGMKPLPSDAEAAEAARQRIYARYGSPANGSDGTSGRRRRAGRPRNSTDEAAARKAGGARNPPGLAQVPGGAHSPAGLVQHQG